MVMPGKLLAGGTCQTCTMREESSKGSGRRMTALTTEKIAVLAPIPRARTTMAAAENAGLRRRMRKENRKSVNKFLMSMNSRGCWTDRKVGHTLKREKQKIVSQ